PVLVADGIPVEGTISAADGSPVAGARVDLVQNGRRLAATSSDASGVYRFLVTQPDQYTVVAWDDVHGLTTRTVDVQLPGPLTGQSIQFGGGSHRLTLVNGEGQPLSGQSLLLSPQGAAAGDVSYPVTTDADGEALIPHLADGDYTVRAEPAGYAHTDQAFSHSSGNQNTQLVVENEIVLSGQVSFGDGSPVAVPLLVLEHDSSDAQLLIIGESDGSFRSDNLAPGDWSIWVSGYEMKSEFLPSQALTEDTELPVTVEAGGSTLTGAITADGRSVSLAMVSILDQQGRLVKSSFGDLSGSYSLNGLPAGAFTLRVEAAGYALYETPFSFSGSDSVTENVSLAPALAIGISPLAPDPQQPLTVRPSLVEGLGSFATSHISGLQPPSQMPVHQQPVPDISDDCFEISAARNAWLDMHKARDNMNAAYADWSNSYYNGVNSGFNDLGLLSTELGVLTIKVSAMRHIGSLSRAEQGVQRARAAVGALAVDSLVAVRGQGDVKAFVLHGASIFSTKAGYAALANDVFKFLQNNQQAGVNEVAWQHIYNTQEAFYQDAAADYFAARANFYAVTREDCPEEDPEEPEKPNEEEQEDEDEVERRDSRDPNDIVGPLGYGPENWVRSTTQFDYTILFENVPTATAPAQVVMITHILDDDLDLATFELGSFGFDDLVVPVPAGRFSYQTRLSDRLEEGYFVDFSAELNPATRTVTWMLEAIDPATGDLIADPDAGFLPPNVNEPEGEGLVRFSIAPEPNLSTGIHIDAQARIVFDQNEPIDTPVYRNTIDAEAPQSAVEALPESVSPSFTVSWSGADAGAGIVGYDVYVSRDGGAYEKWQHKTTATSATYQGVDGSTYQFYSVAVDGTGQREMTPAEPDATTSVSGERKLFLPVING
ncbi:MAG: MSCRAMM family protein, partial [Chloroflexota bacterium]